MLNFFRLIYFLFAILVTSLVMLPISIVRWRSVSNTELFLKIFKILATPVMGLEVKIFNRDILDGTKPAVVVGNHQHNMDILVAGEVFSYRVISLGKREIGFIPFFGQIFWLSGNILITRGNKESAMKTMKSIEDYVRAQKLGIVIFPEGHRNQKEELLPFKKGAFYTAVNCQIPIVPFCVSQYARHMNLNNWKSGKIYINILPAIPTEGLTEKDIPELMDKVRKSLVEGIKEVNKKAGY